MSAQISADEFMETLTGFDELAIEKHFDRDVMSLFQGAPTKALRALVFIVKRREGLTDTEAKQAVMEMSLKDVNGHFVDADEVIPEEPVTEQGKELSDDANETSTSPPSA